MTSPENKDAFEFTPSMAGQVALMLLEMRADNPEGYKELIIHQFRDMPAEERQNSISRMSLLDKLNNKTRFNYFASIITGKLIEKAEAYDSEHSLATGMSAAELGDL